MTGIDQLLADVGIPFAECPTCKTCNWTFRGAVDVGITEVRCRTCGRIYELMTWIRAVEHISTRLAFAAQSGALGKMGPLYYQLIEVWNDRVFRDDASRQAIVLNPGTFEGDDNEIPY